MEVTSGANIKQFVVFKLGDEEYGVDIHKVTTIEQLKPAARVPQTPVYVVGVINLRGDIIPVMDLRKRFNLPAVDETEDTRNIIIKTDDISIGLIVDAVAEVLQLPEDSIENVTNFSNDLSMDYITGVGKVGERIVTLLNIEKLINLD